MVSGLSSWKIFLKYYQRQSAESGTFRVEWTVVHAVLSKAICISMSNVAQICARVRQIIVKAVKKMPFKRKNFIGFDKYEKHGAYHWKAIELNEDYKRQSGYIINSANQLNPLLILDVGCGDGAIAGKIGSNLPASRVVGIDAEPMAIKLGNRELKKRNIENVHLINLTINDAYDALGSTKYNFIYSLDVIEHLPNPNELLEFSRSRLASNGILIVGTPLFISKQLVSPYHVKEFTISEIRHIVGESNIKEEVVIGGQRKDKNYYAENYYICKLSFS